MPLQKTCSIAAMEANIAAEIRAGKPREQAVAIARATLRDACKEAGQPVPTRKAMDVVKKQATTVIHTLMLPKEKFKTRDAAIQWAADHDFVTEVVRETGDAWRIEQRAANEFGAGTFQTIDLDEARGVKAIIGRPKVQKSARRKRTTEFLEEAFNRAKKVLNPRDFAVIFQASRASAGGKIAAMRRRERTEMSAGERVAIERTALSQLSNAELDDFAGALSKAYRKKSKTGGDTRSVLARARKVLSEYNRRNRTAPSGNLFGEVAKQAGKSAIKKGFLSGNPDGGMHAHGLDRQHDKTYDDGAHMHAWRMPATGELVISTEDGYHAHGLQTNDLTVSGGEHSHLVQLPNGSVVQTKLDGQHSHELMIETTGFGGGHRHFLVMPDGSQLDSLLPREILTDLDEAPFSAPLPHASEISQALIEARVAKEEAEAGAALPDELPDLDDAVEMIAKGGVIPQPVFNAEVTHADEFGAWCGGVDVSCLGPDVAVGDMVSVRSDGEVIGFSECSVPDSAEDIAKTAVHWELISKHTRQVPFVGPKDAPLLFVAMAPNELEVARGEAIVGEDAIAFNELYLGPLGLKKSAVAIGFATPVLPYKQISTEVSDIWTDHLKAGLTRHSGAKVVALGKPVREVLKKAGVDFVPLPHPYAVRRFGNTGEVKRKMHAIAKSLDGLLPAVPNCLHRDGPPSQGGATGNLADAISEMWQTGHVKCRVVKAAEEKQIVYGVVLDPYDVDLQDEWVPPAEVQSTAHGFMEKSRVIGFEHLERADASIVESWVETYPSKEDYHSAMANQPHRVLVRKFGDDRIHSGTWMAGVRLGDREWKLHKEGKLNSFSVGGFSFKTKVSTSAMPEVEFVELVES